MDFGLSSKECISSGMWNAVSWCNRESRAQFENQIKSWVYLRRITRSTMNKKAPFC